MPVPALDRTAPAPVPAPLIDPMYAAKVKAMVDEVNAAVRAGLPDDPKVRQAPPAVDANEIQNTMIGGAPHPNGSGHGHTARQLASTLNAR